MPPDPLLKNKKILITGGEGFVGRHLQKFLSPHNEIFIADQSSGTDLCDPDCLKNLPDCNVIFHLAADSFVPDSFQFPHRFIRNNVTSTTHMLEHARNHKASFVLASSYMYGIPDYLPTDEKHPVKITNPYMGSKFLSEEVCRQYHRLFDIKTIILRFFNIYGPGQRKEFLIPSIMEQIKTKQHVSLKDPKPKRDFVYIDDVISAYDAAGASDIPFGIFNISSGESSSIKDILKIINNLCTVAFQTEFDEEVRPNEISETLADIKKAKSELHWKPNYSLEDGIKKILKSEGLCE